MHSGLPRQAIQKSRVADHEGLYRSETATETSDAAPAACEGVEASERGGAEARHHPLVLMGQMDLMDLRITHSPKTNMEPENQLFDKETHLPNISKPSFSGSVLVFGGSSQVLVDCPDWKDSLFLVARPSIPPVTSLVRPT